VSRWEAYAAHSLVWALSGLSLVLVGILANSIGTSFAETSMAPAATIAVTSVNGYCLYLATGSIACFISSLSRSRGAAVGAVLAVVIISFLINFLAEFWEPARSLRFLSLLNYYEPLRIFQEAAWPLGNLVVLTVSATVLWTAGGVVFQRRDIAVR
jgi:ABC-type transport system involved in multi-copper enzyme maturation permease subunit